MKTNIQKNALVIALSLLNILAFTFTSCQKEQVAQPAQTDQAVQSNSAASRNAVKSIVTASPPIDWSLVTALR